MNTNLTIEGVNELINEFNIKKKNLLATALKTHYQCQLPCLRDLSNKNKKCIIRCQQRLDGFDQLKKNTNKRYDAFLFKYDFNTLAQLQGTDNSESLNQLA